MTKRRPWWPFWTSFYDDASDLDGKQQAIVVALMTIAWRQPDAALPDDITWVRGRVKVLINDTVSVAAIGALLTRFFALEADGRWHHPDLKRARNSYETRSKTQQENAWKRWGKTKKTNGLGDATGYATAYATAMRKEKEEPKGSSSSDAFSEDDASEDASYDEGKLDDEIPF
jgi:uncharacterized protein YdaU (DUF1376 family)